MLVQLHVCLCVLIGVCVLFEIRSAFSPQLEYEECWWTGSRIVGRDHTAKPGGFPYMVSIRRIWTLENGTRTILHHCGGSIINERWVLTAAHCVYLTPRSSFIITVGSNDLNRGGKTHFLENIKIHRDYNPQNTHSDLALIRVTTPFKWTNDPIVRPIALNQDPWNEPKKGVISGWGLAGKNGTEHKSALQYLEEKIIPIDECQQEHSPVPIYVSYLCGRGDLCSGACGGDSGSPLVWNGVQYGIASWIRQPCGKHPDIYVNVAYYIGWIKYTILSVSKNVK